MRTDNNLKPMLMDAKFCVESEFRGLVCAFLRAFTLLDIIWGQIEPIWGFSDALFLQKKSVAEEIKMPGGPRILSIPFQKKP